MRQSFHRPTGCTTARRKTIIEPECKVFLWRRCGEGCQHFLGGSDKGENIWKTESEVQPQSGLFSSVFTSDPRHIPQPWFRGQRSLSHLQINNEPLLIQGTLQCLHTQRLTHIKTHKAPTDLPEKRPPPTQCQSPSVYWGMFHLIFSKPLASPYSCVWEFPGRADFGDCIVYLPDGVRTFRPGILGAPASNTLGWWLLFPQHRYRGGRTWPNAKGLYCSWNEEELSHAGKILF